MKSLFIVLFTFSLSAQARPLLNEECKGFSANGRSIYIHAKTRLHEQDPTKEIGQVKVLIEGDEAVEEADLPVYNYEYDTFPIYQMNGEDFTLSLMTTFNETYAYFYGLTVSGEVVRLKCKSVPIE